MPVVANFSSIPTVTFLSAYTLGNSPARTATSTAASNRFIVFVTSASATAVMSSCSINGVSASVANSGSASFACAYVPTGSSITATPTFSSGGVATAFGMAAMYAVYGLESSVWRATAFNAASFGASATVSIPQDGVLFAPVWLDNDNQSPGFTNATLDFESDNGGGAGLATGHRDASPGGSYTVSIFAGFSTQLRMGLGVLR